MASKRDGAGGGPKSAGRKGGGATAIAAAIEDAAPAPGAGVVVPFGFEMRPEGLYRLKTTEKPEFRVSGPFEIVAESRPEAHDEWGLLLRWADADRRIHEWIMPKRLLAGEAVEIRARMIKCGLDLATHDVARRALVQFLAAVRIPARVRTVSATGWYRPPAGNAAFVLPRQTLGVVTGEVVRLDIDPPPPIYQQRGTLAGWRDDVSAKCLGNSRLVFGICCAFTAPVLALAEDEGGGINLRGGSSTGKTTIVDVAASAWGKPSRSGRDPFTRSWRQTDNALEETALAHNHVLLPLDELGEADPAKLGAALYMLSNGQGKGRQLAGGGARRTASFLTLVLSSSEESAASLVEQAHRRFKAGQEVRMLDVPAIVPAGFGCFETLHGAANGAAFQQAMRKAMQAHYGLAGPAFVAWLADQLARSPDLIAETVLPRVAAWCRDYLPGKADGQVHRAARRLGMVAIAGEMAIEAGIVEWPKGTAAAMVGAVLGDWIAERGGSGSREDHHLFVAFRRFIGMHGASRFAVVGNPDDHNPKDDGAQVEPPLTAGPHVMAQAGWRWEEITEIGERVWIYGILQEVFDAEIAGPLGMEPRDAAARLGSGGFIRKFMEGGETRWKRKFRIAGRGRPRLMVAEAHVLEAE